MNDVKGITVKNKSTISYINMSTVIRPTEQDLTNCKTDTTARKHDVEIEVDEQPTEEQSSDSDDADDNFDPTSKRCF